MLCLMAAMPTVSPAQEINPIQAFIDSVALANTEIAPDGTKRMKRVTRATVTVLDLSLARYASYKNLTYTLDVTTSIKVINGTIGAADGFKGDRSGNAVAPLVRVKNGATLYIDATAGVNAGTLATTVCPAAVALYDCSTLSHGGTITAPDNGTGVAIYLDSDCCTLTDDGGSTNGTTVTNGTLEPGIAIDATNFPDENFRKYLLAQDYGTDAWLTYTEIDAIKTINVGTKNIADLTGISYFTELETLDCYDNSIATLDVSALTKLTYLDCGNNKLTALDVTQNTALTYLNCGKIIKTEPGYDFVLGNNRNQIKTLDLSKNKKLETLGCSDNLLTDIDIFHLMNMTKLRVLDCSNNSITSLSMYYNKQLECLNCSNNPLGYFSVYENTNLKALFCDNTGREGDMDISKLTKLEQFSCGGNSLLMIVAPEGLGVSVRCNVDQTVDETLYSLGNNRYALDVPDNFDVTHVREIRIYTDNESTWEDLELDNSTGARPFEVIGGHLVFSSAQAPEKLWYSYKFNQVNPNVIVLGSHDGIDVTVNVSSIGSLPTMFTTEDITTNRGGQVWLAIKEIVSGSKEFDLVLPEGVSVAIDSEGKYITSNDGEGTVTVTPSANGMYHVNIIRDGSGYYYPQNTEDIYSNILLDVADAIDEGDYTIMLQNCYYKTYIATSVVNTIYHLYADDACKLNVNSILLGDVNADGFVTISDPVSIFGWLMEQPQQVFVEEAADYNRDNVITISDGVSIIAYLMDGQSQASRRAASSMETRDDIMLNVADNGFGLALANEREFTAFTMDITLPEGEALRSVKLDSRRSNGHAIGWQRLHNGIYRVICYSPVMQPFAGTDGALVCFETDGAFSGNVTVDNITFVDTNCNEKSMESLNNSDDGISEPQMSSAPSATLYDLGGRRITSPRHGIYVQKGRKLVVKEVK